MLLYFFTLVKVHINTVQIESNNLQAQAETLACSTYDHCQHVACVDRKGNLDCCDQPPELSAVMGAQAFAGGPQPPGGGGAYPPRQDPCETRMPYSPRGGRTPGGSFRTPFSSIPHTRFSQPQSQSVPVTQPSSESQVLSQLAMTADSSADATQSTQQVITNLEELSLTDSMSAQRLSPIVTHSGLSPSSMLASSAQSNAPKGQQQPAAPAVAQSSPPTLLPEQALQGSELAPLPVAEPSLTGSETGNDAVAATEDTVAAPSSSQAAQTD